MTWNFHQSTRDPLPVVDFKKKNKDKLAGNPKVFFFRKSNSVEIRKICFFKGTKSRKKGNKKRREKSGYRREFCVRIEGQTKHPDRKIVRFVYKNDVVKSLFYLLE